MSQSEKDDDELVLSPHALDALKQFYSERDTRTEQFEKLKVAAEREAAGGLEEKDEGDKGMGTAAAEPLSMSAFTEDWNESQFWYADETANLLAKQLLGGATAETSIAVVSAPSVFISLKNLLNASDFSGNKPRLILLEHDRRFAVFPEFVFYDFAQPVRLPADLKGSVDRLIADPPFLSEDCQTKVALTVRWMAKTAPPGTANSNEPSQSPRFILCTGERMEGLVQRLYRPLGLQTTDYDPVHARGLSNEFYCYANFVCGAWQWRKHEQPASGTQEGISEGEAVGGGGAENGKKPL